MARQEARGDFFALSFVSQAALSPRLGGIRTQPERKCSRPPSRARKSKSVCVDRLLKSVREAAEEDNRYRSNPGVLKWRVTLYFPVKVGCFKMFCWYFNMSSEKKSVGYFFEKDIYTKKQKQTVAKMIF